MAGRPRPPHTEVESINAIAARLRALRVALGLTQVDMANSIGSRSGAQMWANYEGAFRRISPDHVMALCRRYGVTMDWVYRGRPDMMPLELMQRIREAEDKKRHQA